MFSSYRYATGMCNHSRLKYRDGLLIHVDIPAVLKFMYVVASDTSSSYQVLASQMM